MKSWEIAALAIVIVVVAVGGAWYALTARPASTASSTAPIAYAVALTDPPMVPAGTGALLINYSGVAVHTEGGWISNATATGTVNLLGLQNLSIVIANVRIPGSSIVNMVRLYISNASIVVDGTEYPLMLPSGELTIPITNASRAAPGALVDLQPRVVETYVGNEPVFIMAPAAVAVPLNFTAPPGTVTHLPKHLHESLEHLRANVTITSVVIRVVGNETIINVTVKNNGNEPVEVLGMRAKGPWGIEVPPIRVETKDFSAVINVEGVRANMSMVFFANGTQLLPAVQRASEHMYVKWILPPGAKAKKFGAEWEGNEDEFEHEMKEWEGFMGGPANFGAPSNFSTQFNGFNSSRGHRFGGAANFSGGMGFAGNASPGNQNAANFAGSWSDDEFAGTMGYTLQPGTTATFTFEGTITLGPHMEDSPVWPINITIVPIAGGNYTISILTIPASNATFTTIAG